MRRSRSSSKTSTGSPPERRLSTAMPSCTFSRTAAGRSIWPHSAKGCIARTAAVLRTTPPVTVCPRTSSTPCRRTAKATSGWPRKSACVSLTPKQRHLTPTTAVSFPLTSPSRMTMPSRTARTNCSLPPIGAFWLSARQKSRRKSISRTSCLHPLKSKICR